MLHSFGLGFKPWTEYAQIIRSEITRNAQRLVDFHDHSLLTARLNNDTSDGAFVDYLHALYAANPPDLILAIGAPAANFVQRHRQRIFPGTPMLFTAVEARRVQYDKLTEDDTVVAVAHDFPASFENILRVLPRTKTIAIVNGASPNETFWLEELKRETAPLIGRVKLKFYNELSFEDIMKDVANLPPDSAIFWHLMSVDAAGVAHEANAALSKLSATASAPVLSYIDNFFGDNTTVGGPMHSVEEGSAVAAAVAVRILNGEKAGDIKTPPTRYALPKFDWRQMQRWGISESLLPPGSEVLFREPSAWQKYRMEISAGAAVLLLQAGFIFWLILEHRRRQTAELAARDAISELTQMNRLAAAGELSASIAHEINQPLAAISAQASAGLNWLKRKTPDIEEARTALTKIASQSYRASDIINNLRAMFKRDTQEKRLVDLNKVILSVLDFVGVELRMHGIEARTQLENDLPTVIGIEVQLQQVVLNLVMNAKDALRSAPSRRDLLLKSEQSEPGWVQVSIEDSGAGISPSDLQTVFRPMFTTKSHGMGLGLSICRSIVEAHRGRIWVVSSSESGTTFRFSLPANESAAPLAG
jgi:signal transduction histidine kinase